MKSIKLFGTLLLLLFLVLSFSPNTLATYISPYSEPYTLVKKGDIGNSVKWVQDMLNQVRLFS